MNRDPITEKRWSQRASDLLQGRTITGVRYLTEAEQNGLMWNAAAVVLELSAKGDQPAISIWPSSDDEGNDAGAIFTTNEGLETIPVI